MVLFAALGVQFSTKSGPITRDAGRDLTHRLATAFHLSASASDVHWFGPSASALQPFRTQHAWVLARTPRGRDDVYLVHARHSPEGALLAIESVHNLTRTSAVSERELTARGPWAAWSTGDTQHVYRVHWADASRSPLGSAESLTALQRWQWRLAWLQQTGRLDGVVERRFKLIPPASQVDLTLSASGLQIGSEHGQTHVALQAQRILRGGHLVQEQTPPLPQPGNLLTWAVDRVRSVPWFGDENMQRLKAVAYHAWDWLDRHLPIEREAPVVLVAATQNEAKARRAQPPNEANSPASDSPPARRGWPPPPLRPRLRPPQPGEGQWRTFEDDPFVNSIHGFGSPLASTFLRTDPERPLSRVLITTWDPALVDLHMVSGTDEPVSATGETGSGLIPREPRTMTRLVAAFNGGFQGHHGQFGMLAEGTLYVPPKPYAATVARLGDGSVGFGTWPESDEIPAFITSFRQNLTPLVANGRYNPYQRRWWGGVPSGWEDTTRTVRSGLCLTQAGLVAYFYASKTGPRELAQAMLATGCSYGMHLDMNQGHTGLELYRVAPEPELPPLAMPLDGVWQAEGPVPEAPGLRFRGRRLFKSMQLMNFPRYIQRQTRDFFYLTLRETLPGPALPDAAASPDAEPWQAASLPQHGFPYAMATRSLRPDPQRPGTLVQLWQLDGRLARVTERSDADSTLACFAPTRAAEADGAELWLASGRFGIGSPPSPDVVLVSGAPQAGSQVRAAVGLRNDDRRLVYAQIVTGTPDPADTATLVKALRASGAVPRLYLETPWQLAIAGRDLSGHPLSLPPSGRRCLFRSETPAFRALFKETPIVKRAHWKPLQRQAP